MADVLCPFAKWRPLAEAYDQPVIRPVLSILHSAVDAKGPTTLFYFFNRRDVRLESHFFIRLDGTIEQYMPVNRRADANYKANSFWSAGARCGAVSIETEDDGTPDTTPWTDAQIRSIVRLLLWLHTEWGIPLELATRWDGSGLGYHTLFPHDWTNVRGKTCPGTVRIRQFYDVIVPALTLELAVSTAPLTDDVLDALVVLTYGTFLFRTPESLPTITGGREAMRKDGVAGYVASVANSEEATNKRAALEKVAGW